MTKRWNEGLGFERETQIHELSLSKIILISINNFSVCILWI